MLRFTSPDPQRTRHALLSLVHALVVGKVDYCNSLPAGISGNLIRRLQSVMNAAAGLVFSAKRSDHITPLLHELHWLKALERIQIRLGVLTDRRLHNTAASYPANSMTLVVPATRCSTLGDRVFSVSAARTWNALPSAVRAAPSLASFRQKLKRALFRSSFPDG